MEGFSTLSFLIGFYVGAAIIVFVIMKAASFLGLKGEEPELPAFLAAVFAVIWPISLVLIAYFQQVKRRRGVQ